MRTANTHPIGLTATEVAVAPLYRRRPGA